MISGPQRKFCEAYALDKNGTAAYRKAYPKAKEASARACATKLLTKAYIQEEIALIRAKAAEMPGSDVLSLSEKRNALAAYVRSESHCDIRVADKISAMKLDNELAGEGGEKLEITIRRNW